MERNRTCQASRMNSGFGVVGIDYMGLPPESVTYLQKQIEEWRLWHCMRYPDGYKPPISKTGRFVVRPHVLPQQRNGSKEGCLPVVEDLAPLGVTLRGKEISSRTGAKGVGARVDTSSGLGDGESVPQRTKPTRGDRLESDMYGKTCWEQWEVEKQKMVETLYFNVRYEQMEEVPEYDRGIDVRTQLDLLKGMTKDRSYARKIVKLNNRCFNCGSYGHSVRECWKDVDKAQVEERRQERGGDGLQRYFTGSDVDSRDGSEGRDFGKQNHSNNRKNRRDIVEAHGMEEGELAAQDHHASPLDLSIHEQQDFIPVAGGRQTETAPMTTSVVPMVSLHPPPPPTRHPVYPIRRPMVGRAQRVPPPPPSGPEQYRSNNRYDR